jgi:putative transposase
MQCGIITSMIQTQLKLQLTNKQAKQLDGWLWNLTGVYNWAIRKIELDAKDKIYHFSGYDFQGLLVGHSKRMQIPNHVIRAVALRAHQTWDRRFKKISGKPKLKSNRNKLHSIPFPDPIRHPVKNRISMLGLGLIKFHKQKLPEGKIKCGAIVKRSDNWYLCLVIDAERQPIERKSNNKVGIDPGFKHLLTLSDGSKIEHPRELEKAAKRLKQAQRGVNNKLVGRLQRKVANQKKDRNHKLSLKLVQENSFIAFSKDNIKGIAKKFGKSVNSSNHGQLRSFIEYKSRTGGTRYVEVDSKFSTKTCSTCGARTGPSGWTGLSVRYWNCSCGAAHDRDINAARNVLNAGLGMSLEMPLTRQSEISTVREVHATLYVAIDHSITMERF